MNKVDKNVKFLYFVFILIHCLILLSFGLTHSNPRLLINIIFEINKAIASLSEKSIEQKGIFCLLLLIYFY
jgi:hypothetical protein